MAPRRRGKKPAVKAARRNPLVRHLRRRGGAVLPSARVYRRRPKHRKLPPENGGA